MGKLAFLFPGQASQYPGMGRALYDQVAVSRAVFEAADQALGFSISNICFEGTEDQLRQTPVTQPAILTVSVAAFRALEERGVMPDYVAGHSLGEYSALVAAGGLEFADAVRLVHKRGTYMQDAVPPGEGAMAAVLGLAPALVAEICKKAADGQVISAANLNSPEQTVISGRAEAVKRAVEIASQSGAKRAVMLSVSAPFHCELMAPAQALLEKDLRAAKFHNLRFPLITNVEAEAVTTGDEAREALIKQVCLPVHWEDSIRQMVELGVNTFIEVGPGRVLSGLLRQIDRSVRCFNVEDPPSMESMLEKLAQARAETTES